MGVANLSHFFDDGIGHELVSSNSSGVQMIGAFHPLPAHADSINGRMVALARCRQFHVMG